MQKDTVKKPKIIVIVGATATGKSDLAVSLARKFNGEVVSADSRQVYRGLDIGSGKITEDEMQNVPHHLLSIADPKEKFTVSHFKKLSEEKIGEIVGRGKVPIIAGGTGFYIQALIDNMMLPEIPPNDVLREKLENETVETLHQKLIELDKERAGSIDAKNKRRLIRAIEIVYAMGHVPSIGTGPQHYNPIFIGIDLPDEELKGKIHSRLVSRLENGMIEEVENLHKSGLTFERLEGLGLEYRYVAEYLQEKISKEEMSLKIETESWHFAKRQRMWFKKDKRIVWLRPQEFKTAEKTVKQFLQT